VKGVQAMQLRQIESPEKWTEFWLEKLAGELEKQNYAPADILARKNILRLYLSKNPGNPRTIAISAMLEFVSVHKAESIGPLTFFYTAISHSEKHIEALAGAALIKAEIVIKTKRPLKKTVKTINRPIKKTILKKSKK
jgi:hypothetical protein